MAKKGGRVKTMADAGISEMCKKGPSYLTKTMKNGEIVGVDIDAKRMCKGTKKK